MDQPCNHFDGEYIQPLKSKKSIKLICSTEHPPLENKDEVLYMCLKCHFIGCN